MLKNIDDIYFNLLNAVLHNGFNYVDSSRQIGMRQIPHFEIDYKNISFAPILTTKKIAWRTIIHELIWMLSGSEYITYLKNNNVKIWDADAKRWPVGNDNYVGRVYGAQWRKWRRFPDSATYTVEDQLNNLIKNIKNNFFSRRHVVTAWNPAELEFMALAPCPWAFEIVPATKNSFILKWYQRSVDVFLGLPFDIVTHYLIGKIIEQTTGYTFERLIGCLSNLHLYAPHIPLAEQQLKRKAHSPPMLSMATRVTFNSISIQDFKLKNYSHGPRIKAKMYTIKN